MRRDTHRHTCSYGGAHHTPGVHTWTFRAQRPIQVPELPKPAQARKQAPVQTCLREALADKHMHNPRHRQISEHALRPTTDNAAQTQNTSTHTHADPKTHIQMLTTSDTQTHTPSVSRLGTSKDSCVCLCSPGLSHEYVQNASEKWVKWGFLAHDLRVP